MKIHEQRVRTRTWCLGKSCAKTICQLGLFWAAGSEQREQKGKEGKAEEIRKDIHIYWVAMTCRAFCECYHALWGPQGWIRLHAASPTPLHCPPPHGPVERTGWPQRGRVASGSTMRRGISPDKCSYFFSHIRNLIVDMCLVKILLFTHTETFGYGFAVWRPIYFTGQLKVFVLVMTFLETKEDWITFARSNTKRKEKESKRSLDSWKTGWQFF